MNILKLFGFGIMMLWGSVMVACMFYPLAIILDSWFTLIQVPIICLGVVVVASVASEIFDSIK